jgi:hypothetical protein
MLLIQIHCWRRSHSAGQYGVEINFDLDNPVTGLKENVTKLYQEMQTILFDQINTTVSNAHNNYLMGRLLLKLRSTERTAMFQTL